jgi:pimeloyl-ACP methyl ester carboxylesterase
MNVEVLEREMQHILAALPDVENFTHTLFIRGGLSRYILDEDVQELENAFPDSQLVTIENAGHWVHAEAPDVFINTVLEFLLR